MSAQDYVDSLKELSPEVYVRGERVGRVWEHPLLRQTINHAAHGAELAQDPELRDAALVLSPLNGAPLSRLHHHIQTEQEDALVKARLTREVSSRKIGAGCMSNMLSVA